MFIFLFACMNVKYTNVNVYAMFLFFLTVKEYALKALDLDFIAEMSVLLGV